MEMYLEGFLIALKGAPITVGVSLVAVIIGTLFGLVFALMKKSETKIISLVSKAYIEIGRGTPMIVQALIMAYGIPVLLKENGIDFNWPHLIIPALVV